MSKKKTIVERELERLLVRKIDAFANDDDWPSYEEIRTRATKLGTVFDDWFCEDVKLVKINRYAREFTAYITLSGYPRNGGVVFYCSKIQIRAKGVVTFQGTPDSIDKIDDWIISRNCEISIDNEIIDTDKKPANTNKDDKKAS